MGMVIAHTIVLGDHFINKSSKNKINFKRLWGACEQPQTDILSKMDQPYRLIALDIDGTIRGETLEPSEFVLETFRYPNDLSAEIHIYEIVCLNIFWILLYTGGNRVKVKYDSFV